MSKVLRVLDHGFVALRNIAGPTRRVGSIEFAEDSMEVIARTPPPAFDADDRDPAQAARISFDAMDSSRTLEEDMKLASYLMKNWHTSPFEMIEIWLEMKLPIFVARQFVRHRTVSINEVSGRYVKLPEEWYIMDVVGAKPSKAKQGQVDTLPLEDQAWFKRELNEHCNRGFRLYCEALDRGVAPEHARIALGLGHYTHWLWKQDLHNMMHFLSLRDHSHAQVEAQSYAKAITTHLREVLPKTMELYDEFRRRE